MTVLVDTREHEGKNNHILNYFAEKNIPWMKHKMDYGDYSCMIPANKDLSIPRDLYFDKQIMIERKANLEEYSKNCTAERVRINTEFSLAPKRKVLLIENASYEKLVEGKYNTDYNPKSYWATVFSMWHRHDIPCFFMNDVKYSGQFIFGYLYYFLRECIK